MPSSAARAAIASILFAPSSSEYSLWTCRWAAATPPCPIGLTGPSWQGGQMPPVRGSGQFRVLRPVAAASRRERSQVRARVGRAPRSDAARRRARGARLRARPRWSGSGCAPLAPEHDRRPQASPPPRRRGAERRRSASPPERSTRSLEPALELDRPALELGPDHLARAGSRRRLRSSSRSRSPSPRSRPRAVATASASSACDLPRHSVASLLRTALPRSRSPSASSSTRPRSSASARSRCARRRTSARA